MKKVMACGAMLLMVAACESGDSTRILALLQTPPVVQTRPPILIDPTGKIKLLAFDLEEKSAVPSGQALSFRSELSYDDGVKVGKVGITISGRDAKNAEVVSHNMLFALGAGETATKDLSKPLIISGTSRAGSPNGCRSAWLSIDSSPAIASTHSLRRDILENRAQS